MKLGNGLFAVWPRWRDWLIVRPRPLKRSVLVLVDLTVLVASLWLALAVRWNELYAPPTRLIALAEVALPVLSVATLGWFGFYRLATRYMSGKAWKYVTGCLALSILIWSLLVLISGQPIVPQFVPRSVPFLYCLFGCMFILASRTIAASILRSAGIRIEAAAKAPRAILIYGAGQAGLQLMESIRQTGDLRIAGFIDDTATLAGQYVGDVKVYPPTKIQRLIERENVKQIVLALPPGQKHNKRAILQNLQQYPVEVKQLPTIEDVAVGRVTVSDLRSVGVEDLLGRDPVPPNVALLARQIRGKTVMVTGAGGSIGSELVRQIVKQGPAKLILFDNSEGALYTIDIELQDRFAQAPDKLRPEILAILGSVADERLVNRTLKTHRVETIYHAAAYKHVPLVESNQAAGLINNTFGTLVMARAAREARVERFVLISTDKAVRPTNVMGASKRLAELILQAHASDGECETVFTMVRFGNVLDSSGSVLRRFRKQIEAGGPVTVTHPEVTRYFMSIPEAAELVIQAGAMATGGEVFVLEMGELVRIDAMARSMIRLMGLEVRDDANPNGEIAIQYTGLRPGEKVYEELLLGEDTTGTEHPRIMRNNEPLIPAAELEGHLRSLMSAIETGDTETIVAVLLLTVEGYRVSVPAADPAKRPVTQVAAPSRLLH